MNYTDVSMASKVVKDIGEDFLNCSICLSSYKMPKMLPCIHSFCEECLQKYADKQGTDLQVPCPTCRKVYKLSETGVKGLQTNFLLVNLAERVVLLEKLTSTQESAAICESCKSLEIVAFCVNCNFTVCIKCQSQHSLFPSLHVVISLTHIKDPKFQQEWNQLKSPFCQLHSSEKLNFYCNTCSQLICRDCTIVQHSKPDHECVEASSKFANIKDALCKLLEAGKEELEECSFLLREGAKGYDLMNEGMKRVEKEIDVACKNNLLKIEGKYKDLKAQMLAKIAGRFAPVEEQMVYTKNWIKRMQNTQEITQTLIEENNLWEILAMSTDLTAAFGELKTDRGTIELGPSALKHDIAFNPFPVPEIQLGAWSLPSDVVATDGTGHFFLCDFNKSTKMLSVAKISVEDFQIEHVCSHEWTDDIPNGSDVRAVEYSGRYLVIGNGSTIARFDHVSKSFVSEVRVNGPGPIQCIAYDKHTNRICVTDADNTIHLYNSRFRYAGSYTLQVTSPAVFLCPHNNDFVYYTNKDGIKRYRATNDTHDSLRVPLPTTQTSTLTGIMQSNNDGYHTIFILRKICVSDKAEEIEGNAKAGAWIVQEYRVDLSKVVGTLNCSDDGIRPPMSLFSVHSGDGVTLYLCDDGGKITTHKRGIQTQDALMYERV